MSASTKEEEKQIKEKLKFLGLDLGNIPDFIKNYTPLEYIPSRIPENQNLKSYEYIDVRKIEILLTPENRLDAIEEKYKFSSTLYSYLEPKTEEDIIKHTTFLKMLNEVSIDKIEQIEEEQKLLSKKVPFKVKYKHNYLWQIFYDEKTEKYFYLVTTEDKDYEAFFYLLKEQIKSYKAGKAHKIFVPVYYQYYKEDLIKKSEVEDIEKYLWLFTKEYPNIYKVGDKRNGKKITIVGNTYVYEKIKSTYNITLKTKDEIEQFYKLIKALFILQTELNKFYNFETKINENGGLEFLYSGRIIEYESLTRFINEESEKNIKDIDQIQKRIIEESKELLDLKNACRQKENEYLYKEKQIATYLECKKSFLGKIKYFFKSKKIRKEESVEEKLEKEANNIEKYTLEQKERYRVEDLISICKKKEELEKNLKNIELDLNAIKNKLERLTKKVENATSYINEIDSHKKSIFEFWRFTHKEEPLGLASPEDIKEEQNVIFDKTFDYEEDIEEFGENLDKIQRNIFSKEECDNIYLTSTNIFNLLKNKNISEVDIEKLKKEEKETEFDIFGSVMEDKTKIKILANKKHRENKKDLWQILDIDSKTSNKEIEEKLNNAKDKIKESLEKASLPQNISIYIASDGKIDMKSLEVGHINPENALKDYYELKKINLYRIHLTYGTKAIGLTNIMYYDNKNKTLPEGMNVSDKVLIDLKNVKTELNRQKLFRINQKKNELEEETKIVCIYEYNVI